MFFNFEPDLQSNIGMSIFSSREGEIESEEDHGSSKHYGHCARNGKHCCAILSDIPEDGSVLYKQAAPLKSETGGHEAE